MPAALAKQKPDIDDDFLDQKKSTFEPTGKRPLIVNKDHRLRAGYFKGEGYVLETDKAKKRGPRFAVGYPEHRMAGSFACRTVGRVSSSDPGCFALMMEGEHGAAFTVRVWNTGRIVLGNTPLTGSGFVPPALKTAGHEAPREGNKENELLVVVQDGLMKILVNGKPAADPLRLPEGMSSVRLGFFICQDGSSAGRITLKRFTVWRLGKK